MSARQGMRSGISRHNRLLGWGLGALALLLYVAVTLRWKTGL
jgi:hypothetical protein